LPVNAFETRAGVGLVFEPFIGRRGAYALWSAYFPLMLTAAARDGENARCLSAFSAGIGVAGVAVHFKAWPWSLHKGLPMLDEAEGLSEDQLPAYNAVLWFWLVCSARTGALEPGPPRIEPPMGLKRDIWTRLSPVGGVLSLTFDNLGEAAELEMGALGGEAPLGRHATALEVVPRLLGELEERFDQLDLRSGHVRAGRRGGSDPAARGGGTGA
jgi:hypothetical protein